MFCSFLVGYSLPEKRAFLSLILPIAVSISLVLIADIDSPRRGLIRVRPQNLESLADSLRRAEGHEVGAGSRQGPRSRHGATEDPVLDRCEPSRRFGFSAARLFWPHC
jgi:hypothetical protein